VRHERIAVERPVLAFLDRLVAALLARDSEEIQRLLRHPLAHALTAVVRQEAVTIAGGGVRGFRAPIHTLRLYHQTAHLLGVVEDPASRHVEHRVAGRDRRRPAEPATERDPAKPSPGVAQMELAFGGPASPSMAGDPCPAARPAARSVGDDRRAESPGVGPGVGGWVARRPTPRWVGRQRAPG
jgi:hypothetical protein